MNEKELQKRFLAQGYVTDHALATTMLLMQRLSRPLLVEGEAGVGKTSIAKALTTTLDTELIRLQCYEGLDTNSAVYEWNYSHQLLWINMNRERGLQDSCDNDIFSKRFLLERPLLKAIQHDTPPVLLIDEIDRADESFEAFLLELLSEFQITIPELGTIKATSIPCVILTSNGTRELSDALRRRCLYHYIDYPDHAKEIEIVCNQLPNLQADLAKQIVNIVQRLRNMELQKRPGIAETLDWAKALINLNIHDLKTTQNDIEGTLSCLLKTQEDRHKINRRSLGELIEILP